MILLLLLLASKPLEMTITPQMCMSPCWTRVNLRIYDAKAGDIVRVIADNGDDEYHSSDVNMEENRTSYQLPPWVFKHLGSYSIVAFLMKRDGSVHKVEKVLEVH